jgi:hypothetical protein
MDWEAIKRAEEARRMMDQPGVREAIEHHERMRRAGVDVTRLSNQAEMARELLKSTSYSSSVQQLLAMTESLRRPLPPEWVQARRDFEGFATRFGSSVIEVRNAIQQAADPLRNFLERWRVANGLLNDAVLTAPRDSMLGLIVSQATNVYQANATRIETEITARNLGSTNPLLAADMFIPAVTYLDFSQRTVGRIAEADDGAKRGALGASLVVAETHVTGATELIVTPESFESGTNLQPIIPAEKSYPIYDAVQLDLIDIEDLPPDATYAVLTRFSSAASLAEVTRQTLNAILRCNKTSKLKGRTEIFKSTTQSQEALVMLTGLVVRDESSLRDFVTYLYVLVYEGAGDQKLRFLKEHGGPLDREDCDALWNLKALRNKWLIHDPEHGDTKSIDKSYRSLDEALSSLGLSSYPNGREEYERAQRALLSSLLELHELLEARLASD